MVARCLEEAEDEVVVNANDDGLALFVGNVIVRSVLSERLYGSRHLARGFLDALGDALLRNSLPAVGRRGTLPDQKFKMPPASRFTILDVIVMIALYAYIEYRPSVESIIDSMVSSQILSFLKLLPPLIRSWLPSISSEARGGGERTNSLLYEQLASPLMSILFYVMITSASSVVRDAEGSISFLIGGLLPFCATSTLRAHHVPAMDRGGLYATSDACCLVLPKLYSALDPQRREKFVNSLLSMVSDSFVREVPSDSPIMRQKRLRRQQKDSNAKVTRESRSQRLILLESARAACRTLLIISNDHASDLSQIRGIVLDHMLLLASKSVPTTNDTEYIDAGEDSSSCYHLFDMNCAIVISLLQDTHRGSHYLNTEEGTYNSSMTRSDTSESSELLILCQKLLFSSNLTSTTASNSSNSYRHRATCGIILASRLLRCKLIPVVERGSILNWIITVISPSSSAATPLESLDPEVARWGLTFLKFASSVIPLNESIASSKGLPNTYDRSFLGMSRFMDTQSVCGESDVFNQVNKMLATAAIVQMEGSLRFPIADATSRDDIPRTFLAFAEESLHHSQLLRNKSTTAASMVICGPYFLHGQLARTGYLQRSNAARNKPFLTSINLVADYIYDLVDRYLELGTSKSERWNPRGWLLAKIQLPSCLSESTMEILGMSKHYCLELDSSSLMLDLEANDDDFQKRWRLLFANKAESTITMVTNLVDFVNCIIISISVLCAVLKHAYYHFQQVDALDIKSDETLDGAKCPHKRRRKQLNVLRKLLQLHINKIHTMQRICKNIYVALNGLYYEVCRLNSIDQNIAINSLKKENASSDYQMEKKKEHNARDTTRHSENKGDEDVFIV
ncbi:hypothetical protein ACHAXA_007028 [Cyclostephanos tholiformis]|uniref:Uncharacterized protein n=1 Tax=Cyclostephanos tholiformis TaxID=382380 RepID=A0ABD3RBJ2_9STRA